MVLNDNIDNEKEKELEGWTVISPLLVFGLFFFFPKGHPLGKLKLPGLGSNRSCSAWPIPQPQSHRIRATHVTYATTFSNTGSFNPLKEARDQAHILIDISWVVNLLSHNGNSGTVISWEPSHLPDSHTRPLGIFLECSFASALSMSQYSNIWVGMNMHWGPTMSQALF